MVVAFLNGMPENRSDIRTPFCAGVKITHFSLGELLLKTRDMSHSGAYLNCTENININIGDRITIQSTDIDDAPVISAEIIRIEPGGFAVHYQVD